SRNPAEILIFTMMTVITAATSDASRAKLEDSRSYVSEEGALVLMSGWTGLDFSKYRPDEPILHSRQDAQTSALDAFTIADPDRVWTVREIAKHAAVGGRGPVGSAFEGNWTPRPGSSDPSDPPTPSPLSDNDPFVGPGRIGPRVDDSDSTRRS